MNEFHEAIREHATSELEATERQAYVLANSVYMASRAAHETRKQLTVLIAKLDGLDGPDAALSGLRMMAGHAGYSNSITTGAAEVLAAAAKVAGILETL